MDTKKKFGCQRSFPGNEAEEPFSYLGGSYMLNFCPGISYSSPFFRSFFAYQDIISSGGSLGNWLSLPSDVAQNLIIYKSISKQVGALLGEQQNVAQ